jgi:hypothetical protein
MNDTILEAVVSTSCTCEDYDDINDISYPAEFCFGCYESDKFQAEALLFEWARVNHHEGEFIQVEATEMFWTRISLTRVIPMEKLFDFLTLNGDYTLYFKLEGNSLTVRRTSHDEPTGASFIITPAEEEEYE